MAALLLASGAAAAAAGCGSSHPATPEGLQVQREDLVAAVHALREARPEIDREVTATKAVWPSILHGLPAEAATLPGAKLAAAEREAASLRIPVVFQEANSQGLTGPAFGIAALLRSSVVLVMKAWQMIGYSIGQIEHGTPAQASFARKTVNLYIESVYDADFGLAQLGKKVTKGYEQLKGPEAFGPTLTEGEVKRLAGLFSEPRYRLYPHETVRFGT